MESSEHIPDHARKVFQGKIFSVWQWKQELYDGTTATFERVKRADAVHTVGVLLNKKILLTWDEQPDRSGVLTPAGGRVEAGETPAAAAKREFLEETGYKIGTLMPWHEYAPSAKTDWMVYAFVGKNLRRVSEPTPDAGERIELRTFAFDEFLALGSHPSLRDKMLRIILLEARLDRKKKETLYNLLYG